MKRQHGHCWEAVCSRCDKANGAVWQESEPSDSPFECGWCDGRTEWIYTFVEPVGSLGRISGYSTSDSDFTPHYNTATGRYVRSLSEMKYLQRKHGLEDVVVKGDGERYVPRDFETSAARLRKEAERHGIRSSFED